jgi:hypothetical protein
MDNAGCVAMGGGHYIFCVVFLYIIAERICEAAMGRTGVWGHNMINKKRQKEFKQFKYKKRRMRRE